MVGSGGDQKGSDPTGSGSTTLVPTMDPPDDYRISILSWISGHFLQLLQIISSEKFITS